MLPVMIIGKHVYGSMYDLKEERAYEDPEFLKEVVIEAVKRANAKLVEVKAWKLEGEKGGVSVLALVEESHIAIHTWKEYKYATYDIYTCGSHTDPWKAFEYIKEKLKPKTVTIHYSDRSQLFKEEK